MLQSLLYTKKKRRELGESMVTLSTAKKGILASILAAVFFTTMDVGAKKLIHLGTGEITFFRGVIGLLLLPFMARMESRPVFPEKTICSSISGDCSAVPVCCFSSIVSTD